MTEIHSKTLREARFYLTELQSLESDTLSKYNIDISNKEDIDRAINQFFREKITIHKKDNKYITDTIGHLNHLLNNNFIKDDELSPLFITDRICYFSFLTIKSNMQPKHMTSNQYIYPELKNNPNNKKNMINFIYSYFDSCSFKKEEIIKEINEIQKLYLNETKEFHKIFDWLDKKNKEQCEWVYNYIIKYFYNNLTTLKPTSLIIHPTPVGNEEQYNFAIGTIDSWLNQHRDTKKIFLIQINKAWNQYKFRMQTKNENRTCVNIYINVDTKIKLEELSKFRNKKMNKLIEEIIEKEHNKIFLSEKEITNE